MWDDEINKKIKDAADQYHPAYDENAWDKMELLLDEHLPVEKKRKKRKYFLILMLSLLLGGSLFTVYYYNQNRPLSKNSQNPGSANNITSTQSAKTNSRINDEDASSSNITEKATNTTKPLSPLNQENIGQHSKNSIIETNGNEPAKPYVNTTRATSLNIGAKTNATIVSGAVGEETDAKNKVDKNLTINEQQNIGRKSIVPERPVAINNDPNIKEEIAKVKEDSVNSKEVAKAKNNNKPAARKKLTLSNKSFKNNFAINISAGPDVSSVGFNKTGKVAINFGAAISYALSHRFTLRTGFYRAEKIYSASKDQYHVTSGGNVAYLYSIDANCKVYEIPVTVSYILGKAKSHQWFASAGLSSYLMKKESYDYYYKYPNGNAYTKSWSISNKNQHYLSVLDVSAGYEYSFSKRASLIAEPYLKMPLSGIGAGKVKLNSAGVLFTFALKPFYKK